MDYPDVSFVLQIGLTDRDQYIHRLGRTARAGKSGTGMLVLAPFEYDYMTRRELSDLPLEVTHFSTLPTALSPLVRFFRFGVLFIFKEICAFDIAFTKPSLLFLSIFCVLLQ